MIYMVILAVQKSLSSSSSQLRPALPWFCLCEERYIPQRALCSRRADVIDIAGEGDIFHPVGIGGHAGGNIAEGVKGTAMNGTIMIQHFLCSFKCCKRQCPGSISKSSILSKPDNSWIWARTPSITFSLISIPFFKSLCAEEIDDSSTHRIHLYIRIVL